jgi:hypothetical protein
MTLPPVLTVSACAAAVAMTAAANATLEMRDTSLLQTIRILPKRAM